MRKFSSILIVGVGSIGKRHFSLFKKYFEKIDLCDVNLGRCKSIMKDNKKIINKIGSNFSKMISKNNYKVVCITTPPHMHLKIAELAIKSNANIFIEKPLGMNNKGWKKISLECKKKKLVNFIAYCHRFIPYTKILKDILKSNKIGKVHFVNLRWGSYLPDWHPYEDYRSFYMSKKSQGGGALMDESHGIDLLRYLFGEIKSVYADVKNISELGAASSTMANIYVKRTGGFVLGGTRAIIKVNGNKEGSLYPNDFLKVNSVPGYATFTVAGDPLSGVFGSVNTNINVKAGQSYYFIIGVGSSKGLGILLGGVIGQAATGGPFTVQQVTQEAYFGYSYDASQDP